MKKSTLKKTLAVVSTAVICTTALPQAVLATPKAVPENEIVSPLFIIIDKTSLELSIVSGKTLNCYSKTDVGAGYTAGVVMELQRMNGGTPTTVKSWTAKGYGSILKDENHTVSSGTYRLKVTHQAYDGSGNLIESTVKYSSEITVN